MKRLVLIILTLFLFFTNTVADANSNITQKDLKVSVKDGFNIHATLTYPKNKKEVPTVVLLHSLGYNSQWWGTLISDLEQQGYAVLSIDLRGHGKSIYNAKLSKISCSNLKNSAYAKYPDDVLSVIDYIKKEDPKHSFFKNWAIVGSDIGASTGVIVADKIDTKPKTIVMLSPITETKGLYIPVHIAQLSNTDFLSIIGDNDQSSKTSYEYLKRFAQNEFALYKSTSRSSGMLMLKNDTSLSKVITEWIKEYLN
jgi:pimeloyl-ACP methyl ester carboxylesterase